MLRERFGEGVTAPYRLEHLGRDPLELRGLGELRERGQTAVERHACLQERRELASKNQQFRCLDALAPKGRQCEGRGRAGRRRASGADSDGDQALLAQALDDRALLAGLHRALDDLPLKVGCSILKLRHETSW